jgi:benzil reductase ((S)-benzoin forming)
MAKVCILIGGSRGLGKSLLALYQQQGFTVLEFSRSGSGDSHLELDMSRREAAIDTVDRMLADLARERWDEVQLIINAATIGPIGPLALSEPKQWWQHLDVNFTVPISILGRYQYHFGAYPARKVAAFVSSGAAHSAIDGWGLYCASKAGVNHFLRVMAAEQSLQPLPIECAILDPGVMATQMQATLREASVAQFSQVQSFIQLHQNGQLAAPETVAQNIYRRLAEPVHSTEVLDVSGH